MSQRWEGFSFSDHALARMKELELHQRDVLPVLLDPEIRYRADRGRHHPSKDRWRLSGHTSDGLPITVIVTDNKCVVTVTPWVKDATTYVREK